MDIRYKIGIHIVCISNCSTYNYSTKISRIKISGIANGTDTGSGSAINVGYQSDGWFKLSTTPLFFTRTGYLWDTEYRLTATDALYWSATSYSGTSAYYLSAGSGGLYPANNYNRERGFIVRCLARRQHNLISV